MPFAVPSGEDATARLAEVLACIYVMFNEGYLSAGPGAAERADLADDADWLAGLLADLDQLVSHRAPGVKIRGSAATNRPHNGAAARPAQVRRRAYRVPMRFAASPTARRGWPVPETTAG